MFNVAIYIQKLVSFFPFHSEDSAMETDAYIFARLDQFQQATALSTTMTEHQEEPEEPFPNITPLYCIYDFGIGRCPPSLRKGALSRCT